MRRFENAARQEHANFLALSASERLFVQTWIELFDRSVPLEFRCRPIWRQKVEQELLTAPAGFQRQALEEEAADLRPAAQLRHIDLSALEHDPVGTAEALGVAASSIGFSPEWLFQAYKSMLDTSEPTFLFRLADIRNEWEANANPRPFDVAFEYRKTGRLSQDITVRAWHELAPSMRDEASRSSEWLSHRPGRTPDSIKFLSIAVDAADPFGAAAGATTFVESRFAGIRALRDGGIPQIDPTWALVTDALYQPEPSNYCLQLRPHRFRLRRSFHNDLLPSLHAISDRDERFRTIVTAQAGALEALQRGALAEALRLAAPGYELAFAGCKSALSGPASSTPWREARIFVENAAWLLALDWPRRYFRYLTEYCLRPTYLLQNRALLPLSAQVPDIAFSIIADQREWLTHFARTPWDALLQHRRDQFLEQTRDLPRTLSRVRQWLRWDLCRAVRVRNALIHKGEAITDEYVIGVVVDALDLVMRLMIVAEAQRISFDDLIGLALDDFNALSTSTRSAWLAKLVPYGWRCWESRQPSDFLRTARLC